MKYYATKEKLLLCKWNSKGVFAKGNKSRAESQISGNFTQLKIKQENK